MSKLKHGLFILLTTGWALIGVWSWRTTLEATEMATSSSPSLNHAEQLKDWQPYAELKDSVVVEEEVELPQEPPLIEESASASTEESLSSTVEEEVQELTPVFKVSKLTTRLKEDLDRYSSPDPNVLTYDQLRLVTVTHWGFDDHLHIGELLVHQEVAEEVKEIFKEVFEAHYPIEKMKLILEYDNSDVASMMDNNTSAYNYREVTKGTALSMHAYGLAIDINPKMNPYVSEEVVLPSNGVVYTDRSQTTLGMIQPGDALHTAFISRGWEWGGDWTDIKDYQHFSKPLGDKKD